MIDTNKVRDFAIAAHGDQKYGDHPYVYHLDQVAELVRRWYNGPHNDIIEAVAYLHDVLEDTNITRSEIEEFFGIIDGPLIAQLVFNLTDGPGRNRAERKLNTWYKIRSHEVSIIVKMADRYCNSVPGKLKSMYQKEFAVFQAALYTPGQFTSQWEELIERTNA